MKLESFLILAFLIAVFSYVGWINLDGLTRGNPAIVEIFNSLGRDLSGTGYARR